MPDNPPDRPFASSDNHVNVVRQYAARINGILSFFYRITEALRDNHCLNTGQFHCALGKHTFCFFSKFTVMRFTCDRNSGICLCGFTKPCKFPFSHKLRPRTARVVRQPVAVRSKNHMISKDSHSLIQYTISGRTCPPCQTIHYIIPGGPARRVCPANHYREGQYRKAISVPFLNLPALDIIR